MRLDVDMTTDEQGITTDLVEAQAVQPWMLYYDGTADEVFMVEDRPWPYVSTEYGRPERWVRIPLFPSDSTDPVESPATTRLEIVFGAAPEGLQPMLPEDLYGSLDSQALARNGMCHASVEEDEPAEPSGYHTGSDGGEVAEWDGVLFCGRPADPDSYYRFCTDHDQEARAESDDWVTRGYDPTYGAVAELLG